MPKPKQLNQQRQRVLASQRQSRAGHVFALLGNLVSVALCESVTVQCLINVFLQDKTAHFRVAFMFNQHLYMPHLSDG